ncbi:MAG: Hsp20/alpha crystallin family protein [Bacteroidetes bacterium]|nr:MAG: Hsp20/alpha crystallin family protein [Bacteroidota bacterium]
MSLFNGGLFPSTFRFFDDFLTRDLFEWPLRSFALTRGTMPEVNIQETHDSFVVEMAAPGLRKDDFEVELRDNVLTIRSRYQQEQELAEGERYVLREFGYQPFERSFTLNKEVVDQEHVQAAYEDGILRLTIPKREEVKSLPPRKIAVS